jgi:hypothetical protein
MDAPTAARALDQPVIEDGIRWLNFFNGRVLSAEDLRVDHEAIHRARQQLGRGLGGGVVAGLGVNEATSSSVPRPVLSVKPGLAFNAAGDAIEIGREVTVGLVRIDAPTDTAGSTFASCDVVLAGTTGLGAYVLTVGPADAGQGKAPVAGLGNEAASCNTAYSVEGVRFRLFPVPIESEDVDDADLRNRLAYRMFGQQDPDRLGFVRDPFAAADAEYGELDALRHACFETDVALAIVFWQPGEGLRFIDMWSVRRRATPASPSTSHASPMLDRRLADAEARFLQFEDHVGGLFRAASDPASIVATTGFRFLPPAGIVPLPTPTAYATFFRGLKYREPVYIEGAHVPGLLHEALSYPTIDTGSGEALWLYVVRENAQRPRFRPPIFDIGLGRFDLIREVALGPSLGFRGSSTAAMASAIVGGPRQISTQSALTPSCVIFTTGHLRYRGDARFDLAYYDFANYAEID